MPSNRNKHQNHETEIYPEYVTSEGRFFFGMLFTIAELFLIGTVAIFVYWVLMHDKGFAWTNNRQQQYNLHGALMLVGFIFLNGQALMMYKLLVCIPKIFVKIIHTVIFVCSISAITIGMVAGIQAQHNVGRGQTAKHFYSIHSWAGLVTTGLFALQFVVGFVSFLVLLCCEKATSTFRKRLLPTHITFGLVTFSLAVLSCVTGIFQTARHRLDGKEGRHDYKNLEEPTIVINVVACCMIGVAIIIPYIVRNCGQKERRGSFSLH